MSRVDAKDALLQQTLKSIPSLAKKLAQQAAVSATEKTVGGMRQCCIKSFAFLNPVILTTDALDAFKNYETLQRIFLQCQSGEYDSVMNKDASSARDHLADDSTPIFEHHFSDNGLVFNTEKALTLATDFALNCRAVHTEHTLTSVKSKGALTAGYYNGTDLLAFLQTNHGYQIALTAYQRVQEYYLRNIGGEQQMADQDWESSLDYYYSVARELLGKVG